MIPLIPIISDKPWEAWENGTSFPGLLIAVVQPGFGHSFAKAALFDEFLFHCFQLLIQQIIRLMNQADRDVCNHLCRTGFDELSIHFECLRCPPSQVTDEQGFPGVIVTCCDCEGS